MIRFLHCLKKVKMNISDIKRLYPFIMAILEEVKMLFIAVFPKIPNTEERRVV